MKSKFWLSLICIVWGIWLVLVLFLMYSEVDKDMIVQKGGLAINAHCVESRSVKGVKFQVDYEDENGAREDYISLPIGIACNEELLARFRMKKINISAYKNHYFGVIVDGVSLRTVDESIRDFNDKKVVIYFSLFIVVVSTFAMFMLSRHRK